MSEQKRGERVVKIQKKYFIIFAVVTAFLFTWTLVPIKADGTTEDIIIAVQQNYPEYFKQNSIISDAIRFISWGIILILRMFTNFCTTLYDHSLGFFALVSEDINSFVPYAQELFTAILAVCIMATGVVLIVKPKKKPDILISLLMIVLALAVQSWVLTPMVTPTQDAVREIAQTDSFTENLISSHVHDLFYIDETLEGGLADLASGDIDIESITTTLSDTRINNLDVNEIVNYASDRLSDQTRGKNGILGKKLEYYTNSDGTEEPYLAEIYNGFGWNDGESDDFFNEFFYRYKIDTFEIILALLACAIVYLMMSYKVIRIVIEIVTGNIMGIFYSANINGNQKVLAIFKEIINAYIVLLLSAVLVRVFIAGEKVLNQMDLSGIEYGFLLIFLAFAIIDGPNIIQRTIGVDAGISSELGKLFAVSQLAQTGMMGMRMAGGAAGTLFRGGKAVAGKAAGAISNAAGEAGSSVEPDIPPEAEGATAGSAADSESSQDTSSSSDAVSGQSPDIPPDANTQSNQGENASPGSETSESNNNADIPPDMNTQHSDDMASGGNGYESIPTEPTQPAGATDIGRTSETLDLSRDKQLSNYEAAQEMNSMIDSRSTNPQVEGISGLGHANTTSMKTDWDDIFKKGDK